MKKSLLTLGFAALAFTLTLSSCKKEEKTVETNNGGTPQESLYERVGGTKMVSDPKNSGQMIEQGRLTLRSVVDSAIFVIAGDKSMAKFFPVLLGEVGSGNLNGFTALSKNFTEFLCFATGSKTIAYTGKSMTAAHNPTSNSRMGNSPDDKVTDVDFDKFIGDIAVALGQNNVTDSKLIGDLVALLETTRADIVQEPTLYTRVGGTTKVADPNNSGQMIEAGRLTLRSVVDSAIFVIAADQQMAKFFPVLLGEVGAGNLNGFQALSKNLTDFLAVACGSKNFSYTGKNMKDAHRHQTNTRMGDDNSDVATNADMDRFIGDVGVALGKNGVTDQQLINDLVDLLNSVRSDIVVP